MAASCPCGAVGAYFSGGLSASISNLTDRLTFSTATTVAKTTANLGTVRSGAFGVGDANGHGYIAGGSSSGSAGLTSSERLTFSSDTQANLTAVLSQGRSKGASVSERSTKAYFCGGATTSDIAVVTSDILTFSSETIAAATTADLPVATENISGTTDGSAKGYVAGGATGTVGTGAVVDVSRITFSSDTITTLTGAALTQARQRLNATSNGSTAAYFLGGATFGPPLAAVKTADKLTFSSETTAALTTANLLTATYFAGTAGDGTTTSYICGGFTTAVTAAAESLTYSTETCANVTTANLSVARDLVASSATTGYG